MAQPIHVAKPAINLDLFLRRLPGCGPDECWLWQGRLDRYGYGKYRQKADGQVFHWKAHRVAYELFVGPIPEGFVIDHLCRNRACVNPGHMEPVTNRVNIQRGVGIGKSGRSIRVKVDGLPICRNGHVVAGDNARPHHQHPHLLRCRQCGIDRSARYNASHR